MERENSGEHTQVECRNAPSNAEIDVHHDLEMNDTENDVQSIKSTDTEEEKAEAVLPKKQTSTVSVEHVNIHDTDDTQLGTLKVFHGEVDVHHVMEINAAQNLPGPSFPHLAGIPVVHNPINDNPILQQLNATREACKILAECNQEALRNISEADPLLNKSVANRGFRSEHCALIAFVTCALIFAVVLTIIYGRVKSNEDLPVNFVHIYRSRAKWFAAPPKYYIPHLSYIPPKFVVISQTETKRCNLSNTCNREVRDIQAAQMAATYHDIAYNFLVAGDGLIYEGRGWYTRSATTPGMECSSLAVAFVGNFTTDLPPKRQIDALKLLLDTSENYGRLAQDYKMFMQREIIQGSENPGLNLSELLEKWPHCVPFDKEYILCD